MKTKYLVCAALAGLSLAGLTACHDAIYATIETEKKVATNTLAQTLTVFGIVTTSPDIYYVAGGGVFQGTLSPSIAGTINWNPNSNNSSRPFNPPGLINNALALFNSSLYGGFIDSSGNGSLYQSDAYYSLGSGGQTQISTVTAGEQVTVLRKAGSYLLMGGAIPNVNGFTYELEYSSTGASGSWTAAPGLTSLPYPIVGVGFDGTNYWAVTSNSVVYEGTTPGTLAQVYPGSLSPTLSGIGSDIINGLFADPVNTGRVFILTKTRGVFYNFASGAGAWTNVSDSSPSGGTGAASFLSVGGPIDSTYTYLVGSDGFGYYTLNASNASFSRFGDTTITLYTSSISQILVDNSAQEDVLLGTNGNGLWRAVFDPTTGNLLTGTNQYWIHE